MEGVTLIQVVSDPFVQTGVLALIGALVTRILLRRYPARRLVFQLAFFLALTGLLYHHRIVPYETAPDGTPPFEHFFLALAKIIWWLNGAWVLTGFTRVFLNLFSNGFYAANKRERNGADDFRPTLKVTTRAVGDE